MTRDPSPSPDWKDSVRPIAVGLTLALIASVPVTTCVGIHTEREMADARMQADAKREAAHVRRERDLIYLQQALADDRTPAGRSKVLEHLTDADDPLVAGWAREELTRTNGEANASERVCKERASQCGDGCASAGAEIGSCVRRCLEQAWDDCARQSIAQRQALPRDPAPVPAPAATEAAVAAREPVARPSVLRAESAAPRAPRPAPAPVPAPALRSGPGTVDFGL